MIDAVLLIAFGGPTRPEEIRPFLANVTRGRRIPPERLEDVAHHYELIGGRSPLNDITFRQAEGLAAELRHRGHSLPVYVGMRNWDPYLKDTLTRMSAAGIRRALGVILSAQQSEAGWSRYQQDVETARAEIGPQAPAVVYAPEWHAQPRFIEAVSAGVADSLAQVPAERRALAKLVFTAHSIPMSTGDVGLYVEQVREGAALAAARCGHADWRIAYQSRSGSPRDPWLEPDICDVIRQLAADGVRDVVVSPIGFICDHAEVLYDLDIEARQVADVAGIQFYRAAAVNDHPAFVAGLADIVGEGLSL